VFRIVYMSRASETFSETQLDKILESARRRNQANKVTGVLFFTGDTFFQVLEGPRKAVEETYDRVYTDGRHQRVRMLQCREVEERRFPDWSMGFPRISDAGAEAEGFFELSKAELENRIPEDAAEDLMKLMKGFAQTKLAA